MDIRICKVQDSRFCSLEEKWAYCSKMIYLNRYKNDANPSYQKIYELFKDKNYFVITTNADHPISACRL